jgi:hypothetical protein
MLNGIGEGEIPKSNFCYEHQNGCKETEIAVECSVLNVCFSFDVRRSFFNTTCERLQYNLALMTLTFESLKKE